MNLESTHAMASHVRDAARSAGVADAPAVPLAQQALQTAQESRETALKVSVGQSSQSALPEITRLAIERDEASSRYVFRTIDQITGEVVRQYPTEKMLLNIAQVHLAIGSKLNIAA